MSRNCPYVLQNSKTLKIPPVSSDMLADIPLIPRSFSGVSYQMGRVNNNIHSTNKKYTIPPPRKQNTLIPCNTNKSKDFNSGKRKCHTIYSEEQNVVGNICSSTGSNNSNYVRGNIFGADFSNNVNNRIIYEYSQPRIKHNLKNGSFSGKLIENYCNLFPNNNFWTGYILILLSIVVNMYKK